MSTGGSPGTLVVVGQGYVGLPLALRAVEVGYRVVGFDLDVDRVKRLADGDSYVEDVTDARLTTALATGRYLPTEDDTQMAGFDVAVHAVHRDIELGPDEPLREGGVPVEHPGPGLGPGEPSGLVLPKGERVRLHPA